ncbi:MAG TPA: D-alanine--D-alanine ligase [Gammaproteobacteria bacterium]|nr:D-alanine--D-alanine ligase [Gammaproteobacteria bacterium]
MKIAVLFGGDSMERDVSVASARQVVAALRSRGHEIVAVDGERGPLSASDEAATFARDIARDPPRAARSFSLPGVVAGLARADYDLVFLAVHGGKGEDGTLQSLLDANGIRFTGSDRLGCSLAWDKSIAKQLFRLAQIPTPAWRIAPIETKAVERDLGFPVIVKPSGQGSTVGLSLVEEPGELDAAIAQASQYDSCVLLESFIAGRELTVGVLGDRALAVGEIIPRDGGIFDYEAKYQADAAEEIFPADVPAEIAKQAQTLALVAHDALRLRAYSRADFRLDVNGGLWCLEVNTLPGLSRGSLLPQSAAAAGIEFDELCERICRAALSY